MTSQPLKRLLILGAGGVAAVNFINALRASDTPYFIVGIDINPYHLEWPKADKVYLAQARLSDEDYILFINKIIRTHNLDFIYAQPDGEVTRLAKLRSQIDAKHFLPPYQTVLTCQDKKATALAWQNAGIINYDTLQVTSRADLDAACDRYHNQFWMRADAGAGGLRSTPVHNYGTAIGWFDYWKARDPDARFIVQKLLSGTDLSVQYLWHEGRLIGAQARERVEYFYPHLSPSGITGTPSVSKAIRRTDVVEMGIRATQTIDPAPPGVFGVDFKEDETGIPRPTEINCGRFFTTSMFYANAGFNLPHLYVPAGFGELSSTAPIINPLPDELLWIRHIDCPAVMIKGEDLKVNR